MSTPQLPETIGGYQHLAPYVEAEASDIFVRAGIVRGFVSSDYAGQTVAALEAEFKDWHIYRKLPCPRQGGDRPLTQDEKDIQAHNEVARAQQAQAAELAAQALREQRPGVIVARAMGCNALPADAKARKGIPVATGFVDYFPKAIVAVARLSQIGNDQHNPGSPLHWDRSKSGDEADAQMRHFIERGKLDNDGVPHDVKNAWRAMAGLEKYLEKNPWP